MNNWYEHGEFGDFLSDRHQHSYMYSSFFQWQAFAQSWPYDTLLIINIRNKSLNLHWDGRIKNGGRIHVCKAHHLPE
jgi:hypothetical protein